MLALGIRRAPALAALRPATQVAVRLATTSRKETKPQVEALPNINTQLAQEEGYRIDGDSGGLLVSEGEYWKQVTDPFGMSAEVDMTVPLPPKMLSKEKLSVSPKHVLRFTERYYLMPGAENHPGARKVILQVKLKELPLSETQAQEVMTIAGPRYSAKTGDLRIICDTFATRQENKVRVVEQLNQIMEAVGVTKKGAKPFAAVPSDPIGSALSIVEDAQETVFRDQSLELRRSGRKSGNMRTRGHAFTFPDVFDPKTGRVTTLRPAPKIKTPEGKAAEGKGAEGKAAEGKAAEGAAAKTGGKTEAAAPAAEGKSKEAAPSPAAGEAKEAAKETKA